MMRNRTLQVVLVLEGVLFLAAAYPIATSLWDPATEGFTMLLSIYFTLGLFLLLAVRRPLAHRSLIAFAGWANVVHGLVMSLMAIGRPADRRELLVQTLVCLVVGVPLIVLTPHRDSARLEPAPSGT